MLFRSASYRIDYGGAFTGTTTFSDVWAQVTVDPTSTAVQLNEDGLYHIGPLQGTSTTTSQFAMAYIYFSATGLTSTTQYHTFRLFDGYPLDPTSTPLGTPLKCQYNAVNDVTIATDSKITSVAVSPTTDVPVGATITMTALGQLGQADNVLFSPSWRNDWNADAYVLESTRFTIEIGRAHV